jgi:molybdopterin biosynthesis enzyme MoaB
MSNPSTQQHREIAAQQGPVHVAIVTVSDTRTRENDTGGDLIENRITVAVVISMPGSPNAVQVAMDKLIMPEIQHLAWEVAR